MENVRTCQFVPDNDNAFRLKFSDGSDAYFKLPEHIWVWQIGQGLRLTANATRELSELAGVIFNYIVATFSTVPDGASVSDTIMAFVRGLLAGTGGIAGHDLMVSVADVLDYIAREQLIAKMIAVCYLKPGENCIDADELTKRVELFDQHVPAKLVRSAMGYFFPGMSQLQANTGSRSNPLPIPMP